MKRTTKVATVIVLVPFGIVELASLMDGVLLVPGLWYILGLVIWGAVIKFGLDLIVWVWRKLR
jgi:hypothetical protein